MNGKLDQKFQQRWEFRRKDGNIDSSSDDSKSNSTDDPVKRRLQLVPVLTSPEEDDDHWDDQIYEEKNQPRTNLKDSYKVRKVSVMSNEEGKRSRAAKGIESCRKRKGAAQKMNRNNLSRRKIPKKKHGHIQEPLLWEELKIFAQSMISKIKTARERTLAQMKEELMKFLAVSMTDTVPFLKMKSGRKTQKCCGLAIGQCSDMNKSAEDRVVSSQSRAIIAPDATESRERLMSSLQKPIELTHDSTRMFPTSYFTVPNVLPPYHLHPGSDLYFKNHLLPGIAANNGGKTSNLVTGVDTHHGVIIKPEHLGHWATRGLMKHQL